jgi:hypothetical protein
MPSAVFAIHAFRSFASLSLSCRRYSHNCMYASETIKGLFLLPSAVIREGSFLPWLIQVEELKWCSVLGTTRYFLQS